MFDPPDIGHCSGTNYNFLSAFPSAATLPCLSDSLRRRYDEIQERVSAVGVCAVLGVRVVAVASLRVIPLVGAGPSHAKRVVLAELSRGEGSAWPPAARRRRHLSCAREKGGPMVPRQRGVPQ